MRLKTAHRAFAALERRRLLKVTRRQEEWRSGQKRPRTLREFLSTLVLHRVPKFRDCESRGVLGRIRILRHLSKHLCERRRFRGLSLRQCCGHGREGLPCKDVLPLSGLLLILCTLFTLCYRLTAVPVACSLQEPQSLLNFSFPRACLGTAAAGGCQSWMGSVLFNSTAQHKDAPGGSPQVCT